MKGGYESLAWLNDKDGNEFVCEIDRLGSRRSFEELSDEEKKRCENVNVIVGTERW